MTDPTELALAMLQRVETPGIEMSPGIARFSTPIGEVAIHVVWIENHTRQRPHRQVLCRRNGRPISRRHLRAWLEMNHG